jgi:hypothetical protein
MAIHDTASTQINTDCQNAQQALQQLCTNLQIPVPFTITPESQSNANPVASPTVAQSTPSPAQQLNPVSTITPPTLNNNGQTPGQNQQSNPNPITQPGMPTNPVNAIPSSSTTNH